MARLFLAALALFWIAGAHAQTPYPPFAQAPDSGCYVSTPTVGAIYQDSTVTGLNNVANGTAIQVAPTTNCPGGTITFLRDDNTSGLHQANWSPVATSIASHPYVLTVDYHPWIGAYAVSGKVFDTGGSVTGSFNIFTCTVIASGTGIAGTWTTPVATATRLPFGWCRTTTSGVAVPGGTALSMQINLMVPNSNIQNFQGNSGYGVLVRGAAIN